MLEKELKFFDDHLAEWLVSQSGKVVVIKGEEVAGFFNTFEEALSEGAQKFGFTSFLVRFVLPEQDEIRIPALTIGILNANIAHSITR